MEIYYSIMNILDYLALNELSNDIQNKLYEILDQLRECDINFGDESKTDYISSLADANDCGADCTSWEMVVARLKELFKTGERISASENTKPMAYDTEYVKRLAERYLAYEKSFDYANEVTTTVEDIIKDFSKVNTPDNPILYYIEFLLDNCNTSDDED